jgi:hypothetical protein
MSHDRATAALALTLALVVGAGAAGAGAGAGAGGLPEIASLAELRALLEALLDLLDGLAATG